MLYSVGYAINLRLQSELFKGITMTLYYIYVRYSRTTNLEMILLLSKHWFIQCIEYSSLIYFILNTL